MRNGTRQVSLLAFLGMACNALPQRYAAEVFSDAQVIVTPDVPYGANIDFQHSDFSIPDLSASEIIQLQYFVANNIPIPTYFFDPASPNTVVKLSDLRMDVYRPDPSVDCEQARPLFIFLHTGDLMPPPLNGRPVGTRKDSSAVEICRRMARHGFVAASLSYRSGWEPDNADPGVRRGSWINALYRAMQDLKQGIRVLKLGTVTYRLDPERVIVCGEGIGGGIALAAATLNDSSDLFIPKLLPNLSEPGISYVDTALAGGLDGFGGQYNLYRPSGYDSDLDLCVSIGGALVDTSWLEPGDVPIVSFHPVFDPFTPFAEGAITTRISGNTVIPVHGPGLFQQVANGYGNNSAFTGLPDGDPFTDRARDLLGTAVVHTGSTIPISAAAEGLFAFVTPDWPASDPGLEEESHPWNWWDPDSPEALTEVAPGITAHDAELAGNPDMSAEKGRAYIDTIMGYMNPRIIAVLGLSTELIAVGEACDDGNAFTYADTINEACICAGTPDAIEEIVDDAELHIAPNPVHDRLTVTSDLGDIHSYELFDHTGRRVRTAPVNAARFTFDRGGLQAGVYLLTLRFDGGRLTRKVVLD